MVSLSSHYVRNMPRRPNDFYPTPEWATVELLHRIISLSGARILEPCAGDGAIAKVLKRTWGEDRIITSDIDPAMDIDFCMDACDDKVYDLLAPDAIITNPPFSLAHIIVPKAVKKASLLVAMLLRLSWLEPAMNRDTWLAENPPDRLLVLPRISFTGDGKTDSVTCGWFIWQKTPVRGPHIEVIPRLNRQVVNAKQ